MFGIGVMQPSQCQSCVSIISHNELHKALEMHNDRLFKVDHDDSQFLTTLCIMCHTTGGKQLTLGGL